MSSWFAVEILWLPMDLSLSLLKESGKMLNKARISLNHHINHLLNMDVCLHSNIQYIICVSKLQTGSSFVSLPLGKDKQRFDMNGRQPRSLSRCGHKFNLDGPLGCVMMCQYMLNRLTGIWYMTTSNCATCHYGDCKRQVSYTKIIVNATCHLSVSDWKYLPFSPVNMEDDPIGKKA